MKKAILTLFVVFGSFMSMAQCPSTTISASQTQYCASDFVNLIILNTPASAVVSWNTGRGWDTTGTTHNASPITTGFMDVSARFSLADGTLCTVDSLGLIYINEIPTPNFSSSKTKLCKGSETIEFIDNTPNSKNRTWVIGGQRYNAPDKSRFITIDQTGFTDVTLVVEDSLGCRNTKTWNNALEMYDNIKLAVQKNNDDNCLPVRTNFSSSFTSTTQSIATYNWTLPGSNKLTANTKNVASVDYTTPGRYNVALTVNTNRGCAYSITKSSIMTVGEKATINTTISKSEICLSEPVTITQTNQPLPGTFNWDIGSDKRSFTSKHEGIFTFRDTGYFDLNLTYSHNNCISKITQPKVINVGGQKAVFSSSNSFHCEAPHTVDFQNTSDTSSGAIAQYAWEIKDSETGIVLVTSSSKNFSTTINKSPSSYDVRLITTSASGCRDTALEQNFISIAPYDFNFFATPKIGCKDQEIRFINRTKSSSYYGLDLFSWEFLNTNKSIVLGASSAPVSRFRYQDTGHFHARLTAANPLGCQQINTLDSAVHIIEPLLGVFPEDSIICATDFLDFTGTSTPTSPQFGHTYIFTHVATGKEYNYEGESVLVSLDEIGDYTLKYHYGTKTDCKDTLVRNIYANGIKGNIVIDTTTGCSPLTLRPRFEVTDNSHIGSNDNSLTYNWGVTPQAGATILGASSANPIVILNEDRVYQVTLFVTNSSGCSYSTTSKTITLGVEGIITSGRDELCLGDSLDLINTTINNPNINIWSVESAKNHTINIKNTSTRIFTPLDTGSYIVRLIVSKNNECTDTVYKTIKTLSLSADFQLVDSTLSCAPATARFINLSVNADSLIWDFGNNTSLRSKTEDTTDFTYQANSITDGYSVRLIAKSSFGCSDTIEKKEFVKIKGPIADFEITNGIGCEPNEVQFINKSTNYDSLFFSYGAGLSTDTNRVQNYTYNNLTDQLFERHSPEIRLRDNNGCEATLKIDNKVSTYNFAEIQLDIDSSEIYCQRQILNVADTGSHATSWVWSMDENLVSSRRSDKITLTDEGINTLELIASNAAGCADTAIRIFDTKGTTPITFSTPDVICKDQPVVITSFTQLSTASDVYLWDLGEENTIGNIQLTSIPEVTMSYRFEGPKNIKLEMTLSNGCTVSDSATINVFNSEDIRKLEMQLAQYTDDNKIEFLFSTVDYPYVDRINVYRNNNLIQTENAQPINRIIDSTFDLSEKYCYNLSISDICGIEGEKGRTHCPVLLDVVSGGNRKVKLDWTYYVGWDRVSEYIIYRQYPDSIFKAIDTVFNTQKTYIDSIDVCNVMYNYKVVALRDGSSARSQSNTKSITPEIDQNTTELLFENVSVPDNEHIELKWPASTYRFNEKYLITKHVTNLATIIDSIYLDNAVQTYVDNDNVTPHIAPYLYKLHQIDNCNEVTNTDKKVETIFLKGENKNAESRIEWSKYEDWSFPIVEHHIELITPTGKNYIQQVGASVFSYIDAGFYEDFSGYYRYQIYSVNSNGDTSYSNVAFITGDGKIYKPNAFSPNGDGLNDLFRFKTVFITNDRNENYSDFEIFIFNRWGEKVFHTNNLDDNWDGTYKGELVPSGVYQYSVKFTDGNNQRFNDAGIIHITH